MHFLWMILIGLIAGAIAKVLMPGPDPGGIVVTILLGIGGSLVAGFLGRLIGWYGPGDRAGLITSVLGAMLILLVYKRLTKDGTSAPPPA